jgi:cation-transporting P-type ATPase 13A2
LTEDGLDVMGVRAVEFSEFIPEEKELATTASSDLLKVLTSCHSLALLGGHFIGDSLEVKMFEATGWNLHEVDHESHLAQEGLRVINTQPGGALQYGILKQFDFSSEHQRMSTICKDMKTNEIFVCCKGAPEVISQLAAPDSGRIQIHFSIFSHQMQIGY